MFSIVILTRNKSEYTRACLESLLKSEGNLEVVVIDNGSTDDTPRLLRDWAEKFASAGQSLRYVLNEKNLGCSTARNMGVEMATHPYIVFLDNDTIIGDPCWLLRLRDVLESDPKIAIVAPKLTYPVPPHLIQCAGVAISPSGRVQFRGRGEPRDDPRFNPPSGREDVQCLISACFMFRKKLYDEIGGLDEAFNPIEYEDLDFCYRARSKGYRCVYVSTVEVHHWESITSDGTPSLPNTYYIIKHGLLFKKRWRHMFEKENGPPDEETKWKKIEIPSMHGKRQR